MEFLFKDANEMGKFFFFLHLSAKYADNIKSSPVFFIAFIRIFYQKK